ncbi:alpha-L-rhamnosidase-related protein [Sinomonas terrae]|uniref:alpha-L-rhamnosidase n=1 Tax=Sinomonas terrae TaxID=2908838 RepID=A0ABS9TXJ1_9MICC|nr:alpha-L-rhamnosidase N-terminal domain-containing protein [Sinomonas terrae]MCH6469080.1 alpha-L-rhamnosidase N-terminal domain-containing protein [Sinomonas terrae]
MPGEVALKPVRLRVEGVERCLTSGPSPRLSWQAEQVSPSYAVDPVAPAAVEPEVRSADGRLLWAPGPLPLPPHATTRVTVPASAALPPAAECRWRVRLQTGDGVWGPWSEEHAFGTGLRDEDWSAQWIGRRPGGRAPLRLAEDSLRWHGTPFLPIPAEASPEFVIEAELRPVLGAAGIAFHSDGPGTGLLLEVAGDGHVALRPLPAWEQPAQPTEWATAPLAEAYAPPSATATPTAAASARPGDGPWRRLRLEARLGRLAVAIDGHHVLGAPLPAATGPLLALHAAPRAEGALRSLTVSDPGGVTRFRYEPAQGLPGWPAETPFRQPDEWTLLRTEIELEGRVQRAVLYAAARHQAWVSVGGSEVLALSSFGYAGEDYYDAADVTEALIGAGPNPAIAVLSHWYGPGQGRAATEPGVIAELRVEYDDGRHVAYGTAPGWRVAEAPYAQAGYRNDEGDPIEHRLAEPPLGWDEPGFDDAAWSPALVLGPYPSEDFPAALHPRRAHVVEQRDEPVRWLEARDGTPVADFGTVRARQPRVVFDASGSARKTRLRAGYGLREDGRVDDSKNASQNTDMSFLTGPIQEAPAEEAPTVRGPVSFDARVHLGFRFLEFEGASPARVDAAVVHAAHPAAAVVDCSEPELTRVLRLLQDSALHGVQERFVDTPTREKGQFLADAANISYATMAAFGEREFTRQALREFMWSGRRYWGSAAERGRVNAVYPNGDGKRDIPDFSLMLPEWVEAYWLRTGDDAFVAELLPQLEETCGYALRSVAEDGPCAGLVRDLEGGSGPYLHGIVDWPAPNRFGYDMSTAARTTVNAQAFSALAATGRLCGVVGLERKEAALAERAELLADAMDRLLRVDGVFVDGLRPDGSSSPHASQHATVFPLAVGATRPEHIASDAERAASLGLRMGPMTWHRLLSALVEAGRVEDALGTVLDDPSRGPLAWLAKGATFAWESWELAEGSDHSQSHAWAAAAWPVLVEGIVGLRRVAPGRFEIRPPECRLDWVRAELPLDEGTLRIFWHRAKDGDDDAALTLECDLPPGTGLASPVSAQPSI